MAFLHPTGDHLKLLSVGCVCVCVFVCLPEDHLGLHDGLCGIALHGCGPQEASRAS